MDRNRKTGFFQAFVDAARGLTRASRSEKHLKFHWIAALGVIVFSLFVGLDAQHWPVLILSMGAVLSAELFNTAVEKLCDRLHPERHPEIGLVKDISAGAVLITALAALAVGLLILGPELWEILGLSY